MFHRYAVAIGAGFAAALLFAVSAETNPLAMALAYLAPLPIMIATMGWGLAAGAVAAVVAALTISVLVRARLRRAVRSFCRLPRLAPPGFRDNAHRALLEDEPGANVPLRRRNRRTGGRDRHSGRHDRADRRNRRLPWLQRGRETSRRGACDVRRRRVRRQRRRARVRRSSCARRSGRDRRLHAFDALRQSVCRGPLGEGVEKPGQAMGRSARLRSASRGRSA